MAYLDENGIEYGDPGYLWDEEVAKEIAADAIDADADAADEAAPEASIPCPGCGATCDGSAVGDHAPDCSDFGDDAPHTVEPDPDPDADPPGYLLALAGAGAAPAAAQVEG